MTAVKAKMRLYVMRVKVGPDRPTLFEFRIGRSLCSRGYNAMNIVCVCFDERQWTAGLSRMPAPMNLTCRRDDWLKNRQFGRA